MKIRKDDNVIILTGKDRGKTGKVTRAFPKDNAVLIAGINVKKKQQKPQKGGQKGQIVEKPMPIDASNVMLIDSATNKGVRVGKKQIGEKFVRVNRKTGAEI